MQGLPTVYLTKMAVVDLIVGDVPRFDVAKSHVELISARPPSGVVELHLRILYV